MLTKRLLRLQRIGLQQHMAFNALAQKPPVLQSMGVQMQRMMSCSNNWKNDMEMLIEYNQTQEQLLEEQIDQQ